MNYAAALAVMADPVDISDRGAGLGWVGGVVVTAVAIAAILLVRNMNKQIRRLPGTDTPVGADAFEGRVQPGHRVADAAGSATEGDGEARPTGER